MLVLLSEAAAAVSISEKCRENKWSNICYLQIGCYEKP